MHPHPLCVRTRLHSGENAAVLNSQGRVAACSLSAGVINRNCYAIAIRPNGLHAQWMWVHGAGFGKKCGYKSFEKGGWRDDERDF